jgi:CRISPR-associated endonuclease/helicase Cas3
MIVIFVSQCEKKAIGKTNRVLDTFADRIGDRVWKTVITNEGLLAVKKLLKKTATKNTAVACHRIYGKNTMDLLWIVGNRDRFGVDGVVPVGITQRDVPGTQFENHWDILPLIQEMVALAALFHDFGKSSVQFQDTLHGKNKRKGDPVRHEWISALFVAATARLSGNTDQDWLEFLENRDWNVGVIVENVRALSTERHPFEGLPLLPSLIVWLVLSHHKLPQTSEKVWKGVEISSIQKLLAIVQDDWGYENYKDGLSRCLEFSHGLPCKVPAWRKEMKKWSSRALCHSHSFETARKRGILRPLLMYARLSLMMGDYGFSSLEKNKQWQKTIDLYANTDGSHAMKQFLDEHLLGVKKQALQIVHMLPSFETNWSFARDIRKLDRKSPPRTRYFWQDRACKQIQDWRRVQGPGVIRFGFFAVNIASTGCGKTFANAKIMKSLSEDLKSLRYVLGLGLRTLTLQTGDEYRNRIGLDDTELAVIIGSRAVELLHGLNDGNDEETDNIKYLFDGEIDSDFVVPESKLSAVLKDEKSRKLLYTPVLACTIDYMMEATETIRGGRWMLPFLRLMSSDLVIDEVDDFSGSDSIAIGRLIHLAGMLGRKVMISSATISPDMAEGYFRVYRDGWRIYARSRDIVPVIGCAWIDEFRSEVVSDEKCFSLDNACVKYRELHDSFIKKRIRNLERAETEQGARRKGIVASCSKILELETKTERTRMYFDTMKDQAIRLHYAHAQVDPKTGKRVSFGCIRVANIDPCIELVRFLVSTDLPVGLSIRTMAYHSRQVLLLRSEQEKHLDSVLRCSTEKDYAAFSNPVIRRHLDSDSASDMIFILVATPVEEVGRDHDFDWAIIEPSSYRSIIQMSGRVRRHRESNGPEPNVVLMQYNLKGLAESQDSPVFCMPGFETRQHMLETHDISRLLQRVPYTRSINAIPRISRQQKLEERTCLVDLEHGSVTRLLSSYDMKGPESMECEIGDGCWPLTGLPPLFAPFRQQSQRMQRLVLSLTEEEEPIFGIFNPEFVLCEHLLDIQKIRLDPSARSRLWLCRDFRDSLESLVERTGDDLIKASFRFGEIQIPDGNGFVYSDNLGIERKKDKEVCFGRDT